MDLLFAVLLWGLLHSLLASIKAKGLFTRLAGNQFPRFYRLFYNFLAIVSFLPVLAIAALKPDRQLYQVPMPWYVLMLVGQVVAVIFLIVGFFQTDAWEFLGLKQLRARRQDVLSTDEKASREVLITKGLYRYVRHPLYTAGLAFIWLMPVMTRNLLVINLGLTVYVIIGAFFEEKKLMREFGQEYAEYAAITPMFMPSLCRNKPGSKSSS